MSDLDPQYVLCREEHTCAPMGDFGLRHSMDCLTSTVLLA